MEPSPIASAELGESERAVRLAQEALALARSMGHLWGTAQGLEQLGTIAHRNGDFDRALLLFEESLARWRQTRSGPGVHGVLLNLGHAALAMGDTDRATASFTESLTIAREAGDRRGAERCLQALAAVATVASPDTREHD